jgi:hypothetical protein
VTYATNIPQLPSILSEGSWARGSTSHPIWDSNYIPSIFVTANEDDMNNLIENVPKNTYTAKITYIGPDDVTTIEVKTFICLFICLYKILIFVYIFRVVLLVFIDLAVRTMMLNNLGFGLSLRVNFMLIVVGSRLDIKKKILLNYVKNSMPISLVTWVHMLMKPTWFVSLLMVKVWVLSTYLTM